MRIAKEQRSSMKSAASTKEHRGVPVTAKNAAQMRGRTGFKSGSGHTAGAAGRKASGGKRGGK